MKDGVMWRKTKMRPERYAKKMKKSGKIRNSYSRQYEGKRQKVSETKSQITGNSDRRRYAEKCQNAAGKKFQRNEKIAKNREF